MENKQFTRNEKLIRQKYREYLLPAVFTSAALSLASVVDSAIVGNLIGTEELGGVGACSPVVALINAIFLLFSIGGATKASVALGERKTGRANQCFSISIILGLVISAVFIAGMLIAAEPVCYLLANRDETLAGYVIQYYRPILFVLPALFMTIGMSQFMRIDGYPKMASYIALASNAVNLVLDYCLIRFAGFGLAGASLSTVLGYVAGIGLVLPYLFSKKRTFRFVNPFKSEFRSCMGAVLSGGSSRFFLNISDFFKRSVMNILVVFYLGNPGLSVLTICNSLLFFSTAVTNGGSDAFLPIVGSLHGEKDQFGIRKCFQSAIKFVLAGCLVLMLIMLIAPTFVGGLFGVDEGKAGEIIPGAIRMLALALPVMGINSNLQTLYNTTGRAKLASAMSIMSGIAYLCLYAFLLPMINNNFFWLAYVCSEVTTLTTAMLIGRHIRKKEGAQGYLLLKKSVPGEERISYTIEADAQAAGQLARQVRQAALDMELSDIQANRIALAVEEMTVAVAEANASRRKKPLIDIGIMRGEEETIVTFRENEKPCNLLLPDPENPPDENSGIEVFKKAATSVEYSRQLGFNTIIAKFERSVS